MHKRLVTGCSLDAAKNSNLCLEQFPLLTDLWSGSALSIFTAEHPGTFFWSKSAFIWQEWMRRVDWTLSLQLAQILSARLTLLPSESDRKQELMQSAFFEPLPFVRGHWFSKRQQCDGKKTVNSFALLLLTGNELCETQRKGVTSLWLWHGSKVELHVGMKPCLIRFCNYFDTILAEACWVKQFLV